MSGAPLRLTDDTRANRRLVRFARDYPRAFARYLTLPVYAPGMVTRCPTAYDDGTLIAADDVPGCGSADVGFDGDGYFCRECGIFFDDYAADPPHRRLETPDGRAIRWTEGDDDDRS